MLVVGDREGRVKTARPPGPLAQALALATVRTVQGLRRPEHRALAMVLGGFVAALANALEPRAPQAGDMEWIERKSRERRMP